MKILFLSLLLLNLLYIPCLGQDHSDEGTYAINLTLINVPSYTVKLPQSVDVTAANTIITYYVKGDIYGDQQLCIVFDENAYISSGNRTVPLTVNQAKDSWSYHELSDSFTGSDVSISHTELKAGTWSGYLNVAISLQGGN